jgi:hypothetical protein
MTGSRRIGRAMRRKIGRHVVKCVTPPVGMARSC